MPRQSTAWDSIFTMVLAVLVFIIGESSGAATDDNAANVTELLNSLLLGYDNSIRPDFGGPPTVVEIDIMVRSMGPISEGADHTYSMDCYFRQSWLDDRLSYNGSIHQKGTLALSIAFERWIWKPDTAFYNGKYSYLHTITSPNKFVRLYQDGRVLYSSRLTVKASCPMNLQDFPMDTQRCPLKLGSFGYTTRDVVYRWNSERTVVIASDMKMSQFDLISTPSANVTDVTKQGEYSFLIVSFHLQRHTGNFLIEVYGPVSLLVVLSWLSFWLNREATADRVSLGVTIILTITFHFTPLSRTDLPKVPYPTALDFFIYLSFAFIFATIIQFAIVHYFTKHGSGEVHLHADSDPDDDDDNDGKYLSKVQQDAGQEQLSFYLTSSQAPFSDPNAIGPDNMNSFNTPHHRINCPPAATTNSIRKRSWSSLCRAVKHPANNKGKKQLDVIESANSVSKIDTVSRYMFPISYITINAFYWYCYQYRDDNKKNK